jgi:tetratricopeptide (TPR) repeat protein/O-antigen ligase
MRQAQRAAIVVCFFVCPLLFFTNLTRNPYITQITLLNLGLLAASALWLARSGGDLARLQSPLDWPLAGWAFACAASWAVAYALHAPFFRPAIVNEGLRNGIFLVVNTLLPFWLAVAVAREGAGDASEAPLAGWAAFVLGWGVLWLGYRELRGGTAAPLDTLGLLLDGYGVFLWATGLAATLWLCRKGRSVDFLHLALATGFLSAVYGLFQYFNVELVWPSALNPYGGRSVSTFGNPNFMSSYMVMMLPFAANWFARSSGGRRLAYGVVVLAMEAALLCSLTRSSWLGAFVALAALAASPSFRSAAAEDPRPFGMLAALSVAMAVLWPQSLIHSGYAPSVIGRVREIGTLLRHEGSYSPFHQRLLIWTCAWLMGHENPLTGKGWGLFELFYPFYQGPILATVDFYRQMRTHANNSHNEILEVFSQTGLLGLGAMLWVWTTLARAVAPRWRGGRNDGLALPAACGALGMLVDNMLNVSLHFAVPAFVFWWLAGTTVGEAPSPAPAPAPAHAPRGRAAAAEPALPPGRRAAVAAGVLLAAALGSYWWRGWFREVHYFAGFKLMRGSQFGQAARELELSKKWGPPEVNAIYELGNAYARSERFGDAASTYGEALDANAGYDEIYFNLGAVTGSHLGQQERSRHAFEMAYWINPLNPEIYNTLGGAYLREPGTFLPQARELLQRATRVFPDNPNNWNNLGYVETLRKDYPAAMAAYERALAIDPSLAIAERNLSALVVQHKLPRPAVLSRLADLRELEALVVKHDYSDKTLALASRLARQLPDVPKAQFYWGSLLLARGQFGESAAALERVVSRDPGHSWAHGNLGEAYLHLGRRDDAVREFRLALSADPQNARAGQRLRELGVQ